jgi:hypothetical protein
MTYQRVSYEDASTVTEMSSDCRVVEATLGLPVRRSRAQRAAGMTRRAAVRPAPSIRYEDHPRDHAKPSIEISEAAARLAAALYLD